MKVCWINFSELSFNRKRSVFQATWWVSGGRGVGVVDHCMTCYAPPSRVVGSYPKLSLVLLSYLTYLGEHLQKIDHPRRARLFAPLEVCALWKDQRRVVWHGARKHSSSSPCVAQRVKTVGISVSSTTVAILSAMWTGLTWHRLFFGTRAWLIGQIDLISIPVLTVNVERVSLKLWVVNRKECAGINEENVGKYICVYYKRIKPHLMWWPAYCICFWQITTMFLAFVVLWHSEQ